VLAARDDAQLVMGLKPGVGPGGVIFEIQQASDRAYRFYDWDWPGADVRPRQAFPIVAGFFL
jgi:mannose-6-phosphate isomerase class I